MDHRLWIGLVLLMACYPIASSAHIIETDSDAVWINYMEVRPSSSFVLNDGTSDIEATSISGQLRFDTDTATYEGREARILDLVLNVQYSVFDTDFYLTLELVGDIHGTYTGFAGDIAWPASSGAWHLYGFSQCQNSFNCFVNGLPTGQMSIDETFDAIPALSHFGASNNLDSDWTNEVSLLPSWLAGSPAADVSQQEFYLYARSTCIDTQIDGQVLPFLRWCVPEPSAGLLIGIGLLGLGSRRVRIH